MTAPGSKTGPLTAADLQAIWAGATDSSYWQPFVAAGDGAGFEAWTQMFAQFARAAQAADVTFEAMYILPFSGQSNPPASGPNPATVELTLQRSPQSAYVGQALTLVSGTLVQEEEPTTGDPAGVVVQTGRYYGLQTTIVLPPGDPGAPAPSDTPGTYGVQAVSQGVGYGFNNPLGQWVDANGNVVLGSVQAIDQPGTQYANTGGSITLTPVGAPLAPAQPPLTPGPAAQAILTAAYSAPMFLPDHVGQYVKMVSGSNSGRIGRVVGFLPAVPTSAGSGVILAFEQAFVIAVPAGTPYATGELVTFTTGGTLQATGFVVGWQLSPGTPQGTPPTSVYLVIELQTGTVAVGSTALGVNSGTTGTVSSILQATTWTAETGTASWQVLDWVADLGLTISNYNPPTGGTSPMLDELGNERDIPRITSEVGDDATYRARIAAVSDVVSPNAIRRALTRAFAKAAFSSQSWVFREVGSPQLPGVFYDRTSDVNGDFYDTNCLLFTTTQAYGIASVAITNPGSGYVAVGVTFSGAGGGTAGAQVNNVGGGGLEYVLITNPGSYTVVPTVSFSGVGTGAAGTVQVGPAYIRGEELWWLDAGGNLVCKGWYGGYVPGTNHLIFIMHSWRSPVRQTIVSGDVIQGMQSGLLYTPNGLSAAASAAGMAESVLLDYPSFRAYFLVQVPDGENGEFGCCYSLLSDASPYDAFYDIVRLSGATVPLNFYDGVKETAETSPYLQVYKQVERTRAAAVGWDMYIETPTGGI